MFCVKYHVLFVYSYTGRYYSIFLSFSCCLWLLVTENINNSPLNKIQHYFLREELKGGGCSKSELEGAVSPAHWVTCPTLNPVRGGGQSFPSRPRGEWHWDNPRNTVPLINISEIGFSFLCKLLTSWGAGDKCFLTPKLVMEAGQDTALVAPGATLTIHPRCDWGGPWRLFIYLDSNVYSWAITTLDKA